MPFKITVQRVPDEAHNSPVVQATQIQEAHLLPVEIFSQTFPEQDFDMTGFVLAINKRKRVRKARSGKDANA